MRFTIDLPNKLGEQLNTFAAPNDFIVKVLAQSLGFDLQNRAEPEFCIEDAFGLYQLYSSTPNAEQRIRLKQDIRCPTLTALTIG